jgi:NCS1 nucleoside transporter family
MPNTSDDFILLERRSIDYVPRSERHGKVWHLWPVWFSGNAQLATVATGAVGVLIGGSLFWMVIAVLLGSAVGTFFMAFHSTQGPQLGLPQMIQSRPQFGYLGALLVWGVALVAYIGFNCFNQILAVQAAQSIHQGHSTSVMLVFTLLSVAVAVSGCDLIHLAQRWIAVLMIAALTILSVAALRIHLPSGGPVLQEFRLVPFLVQFFAAAAYLLSWSIYVSDYSRYLPANVGVRAAFWWTYIGCFWGGAWMMLMGTLSAALYPHLDIATGLRTMADALIPGYGRPFLLISLASLLTMTSLNYYGAALTLLCVADTIKPAGASRAGRIAAMLLAAVVATSLALAASKDFMSEFSGFLDVLLYLFTPWTAINLVDFYIVRRGHYSVREIFNPRGIYGRWNWRGLLAYVSGFAAMIPCFNTSFYRGPVAIALGGADVSMVIGLPVAAIVYLWACRSLDLERDRALAQSADAGLESGGSGIEIEQIAISSS